MKIHHSEAQTTTETPSNPLFLSPVTRIHELPIEQYPNTIDNLIPLESKPPGTPIFHNLNVTSCVYSVLISHSLSILADEKSIM